MLKYPEKEINISIPGWATPFSYPLRVERLRLRAAATSSCVLPLLFVKISGWK
jgi:hypothetical protein